MSRIFRPGSNCDTINGDPYEAHFSFASGRTSFGPTTDPHPYLTDGTPEVSFEITDIQENGCFIDRVDAVVKKEHLLGPIVWIVLEEANQRDTCLTNVEIVNRVAEVEHG